MRSVSDFLKIGVKIVENSFVMTPLYSSGALREVGVWELVIAHPSYSSCQKPKHFRQSCGGQQREILYFDFALRSIQATF